VKYVILDLDGTILDENKRIFPEFLEVLPEIKRRYKVIVVSGRARISVEKYIREMDIEENFVSFEGAYVVWKGKVIFKKPFDENLSRYIEGRFGDLALVKFYEDSVEPNEKFKEKFYPYLQRWGVDTFGNKGEIYKFILALRNSEIRESLPGTVFVYRRNEDVFYDIAPYITKAEGLRILMEFAGINPRDCIAFGDSYNDLGVFEICGFSVAVPWAIKELKEKSHMVAKPWDDEVMKLLMGKTH
jgi:HAD-superfamily hydrolase, subfamily IIB